jgi:hypothetical protein
MFHGKKRLVVDCVTSILNLSKIVVNNLKNAWSVAKRFLFGRVNRIEGDVHMKIEHIREQLHLLIDEVDDIYVLNGLYRNLLADKRQRQEYEQEQVRKAEKAKQKRQ